MKDDKIYYSVGALLYCPANNGSIVRSVTTEKFGTQYSLALCLEDTINDNSVKEAEAIMIQSIKKIYEYSCVHTFYIPKIFIRVRTKEQIERIFAALEDAASIIFGIIIPKFTADIADEYIDEIIKINDTYNRKIYFMPILESSDMIDLRMRRSMLYDIKDKLERVEPLVLNIRVGGNDLCKTFGFRRHNDESIYDIRPVSNILSEIVTVFGRDYVVSGPVWEYYNGEGWDTGLKREIKGDILCGFIGKTVIHPNQIPIVNKAYMVNRKDLEDANAVLNWSKGSVSMVAGSQNNERMNEYKTHAVWAAKVKILAEIYGVIN
ncbi:MAG: HpcH/HpaI aldolase/citrate lyase family protein [Clostridia bacterium]|nr:HpcH/HpaI aldolase/citrate lyase family protein [Clostridia bacterium]